MLTVKTENTVSLGKAAHPGETRSAPEALPWPSCPRACTTLVEGSR